MLVVDFSYVDSYRVSLEGGQVTVYGLRRIDLLDGSISSEASNNILSD